MNVLVLNSGSSSLKFQLIATDLERIGKDADETLCRGDVERIGGEAIVTVQQRKGSKQMFTDALKDIRAALDFVVRRIAPEGLANVHAIGHRVVHGGETFVESALIDDKVLQGIEDCIDLAPLHNPNNIKGILAAREIFGTACRRWPSLTRRFIIPFRSTPTCTLCPITCTGGIVFAGMAFTGPPTAMWHTATGRYGS
jgi:acetate kinase